MAEIPRSAELSMSAQSCAHIFHPCRFPVSYGSGEAVKVKVKVIVKVKVKVLTPHFAQPFERSEALSLTGESGERGP